LLLLPILIANPVLFLFPDLVELLILHLQALLILDLLAALLLLLHARATAHTTAATHAAARPGRLGNLECCSNATDDHQHPFSRIFHFSLLSSEQLPLAATSLPANVPSGRLVARLSRFHGSVSPLPTGCRTSNPAP
jgi:hypothetical protein